MRKRCLLPILALFFSVFISGNLEAATYYIDGSSGNDSKPGTLASPWKTIGKANSTLEAGDTVCLRRGTYSTTINPSNNGTSGNFITYEAYTGETPIVTGATYGVHLAGSDGNERQYIRIKGITFRKPIRGTARRWFYFNYADYITMDDCVFDHGDEDFHYNMSKLENCSYLRFVNCSWDASSMDESSDEQNDLLGVTATKHSIWDSCSFGHVSHAAFWFSGGCNYNVINNCTFTNKWRHGLCIRGEYQLIQNCTFQDMGTSCDTCPCFYDRCVSDKPGRGRMVTGLQLLTPVDHSIIRRNVWDYVSRALSGNFNYGNLQHIKLYSNTFYDSNAPDVATNSHNGTHISAYVGETARATFSHNIIMNNIFWKSKNDQQIEVYSTGGPAYHPHDNILKYNLIADPIQPDEVHWGGSIKNVAYLEDNDSEWIDETYLTINPLMNNPANNDYTLQSNSPCIDAGAWLTTITSSTAGSETSFTVDDAGYFYDGWGVPGETGDTIKTENGQETTITSINYGSNTITVSTAIDIIKGEGVALDYTGTAPDLGAHEYSGVSAPKNFKKK